MANVILGELGSVVELDLVYGASFGPYALAVQRDGVPVDLTDGTLTARLWRPREPFSPVAQLEVVVVDPAAGEIELYLSQLRVAALAMIDGGKKDPLLLEWSLVLSPYQAPGELSSHKRVYYGPVRVTLGARPL